MRIVFVKDWRDIAPWGNQSLLGHKPKTLDDLKTFGGRIHCWGAMRTLGADMLVVNVPEYWYEYKYSLCMQKNHKSDAKWYAEHKNIEPKRFGNNIPNPKQYKRPDEINWSEWDIVAAVNPFMDIDVIKRHKGTLFCFWHHERFMEYYDAHKLGCPVESGWDLHLDHVEGISNLDKLPGSIYCPYFMNTDIRKDFDNICDMIWTDRRTFDENPILAESFESIIPENFAWAHPMGHAGQPIAVNGWEFYNALSRSKYFIYLRNTNGGSGQAALEAASMGSVIIGWHWSKTFNKIVHPFCKIEPNYIWASQYHSPFGGRGFDRISELRDKIKHIESNEFLYKEITTYQNKAIEEIFDSTINNLKKALEIKRGG